MNAFKYIFLMSACFLIACAPPKITPEGTIEGAQLHNKSVKAGAHKANAASISSWEITGALAAKNKQKGWAAQLNWLQQGPNRYQIRLFGPLGGGTIIIAKNGSVITYSDGPKKLSSRSADELLQHQTGIRLPVKNLYYWVRGLPAPGAVTSSHYAPNNQLMTLSQAGYIINYSNYISVNNTDLPSKIQLKGHGVAIKLVIKHWNI